MNRSEILAFALITATLTMFVWGRFRYDLVALGSLLAEGLRLPHAHRPPVQIAAGAPLIARFWPLSPR